MSSKRKSRERRKPLFRLLREEKRELFGQDSNAGAGTSSAELVARRAQQKASGDELLYEGEKWYSMVLVAEQILDILYKSCIIFSTDITRCSQGKIRRFPNGLLRQSER